MALVVHQLSLELITSLRLLMPRISRFDRSLAQQLRRSASSIALNIGEADYSDPGNRRARFSSAAGSAGETRSALKVACAWDYITPEQAAAPLEQLDSIVAMLWSLSRQR